MVKALQTTNGKTEPDWIFSGLKIAKISAWLSQQIFNEPLLVTRRLPCTVAPVCTAQIPGHHWHCRLQEYHKLRKVFNDMPRRVRFFLMRLEGGEIFRQERREIIGSKYMHRASLLIMKISGSSQIIFNSVKHSQEVKSMNCEAGLSRSESQLL